MIPIQDLGIQILQDNPLSLYILGGTEYGVKDKYIQHLRGFYGNQIESQSFDSLLNLMHQKHIVPLKPSLYVVRYDEQFVSDLNDAYVKRIRTAKISGTIVCVYESDKHITKFDKFLPGNTSVIENINPKFISKYLHQDFPKLDDRSIKIAVECSTSYGHARTICKALAMTTPEVLAKYSDTEVASMFGCNDVSTELEIQLQVANRNFGKLVSLISIYQDEPDRLVYTILQTMIELDKIQSSKYSDSSLKAYIKNWTREDIYYMFMNAYEQLTKLRSMSSYDVECSLIYLIGLLKFQRIPSPEVMASDI